MFTQKELSYLDDVLPGKKHVKKRKLTLKEIDVSVLEKARKDQNEIIKRKSVIPEKTRRASTMDEAAGDMKSNTDSASSHASIRNDDVNPFI